MEQEYQEIVNICKVLDEKKAENILLINVSKILSFTENVILATATSFVHAKALANYVSEASPLEALSKEGFGESSWIILDYGFVIVHIFTKELREYYNLEKLYSDGKSKKFETIIKEIKEQEKKEAKVKRIQEKKDTKLVKKTSQSAESKAKAKQKPSKKAPTSSDNLPTDVRVAEDTENGTVNK